MPAHMLSCSFTTGSTRIENDRWHATIVQLLQGTASVTPQPANGFGQESADSAAPQPTQLTATESPILLLNASESAQLRLQSKSLALLCRIDLRQLARRANGRSLSFICTPALRHHERYNELARLFQNHVRTLPDTGDFAELRREASELAIARCLLDGFLNTAAPAAQTRAEQFRAYADAHYNEPIGLAEAARHFGLTPEYFAKAFKRETGETFLGYLASVRLNVACDLLGSTNATVSRVAMEAGFPNSASLNQAFRRALNTTPSQYRKEHASQAAAQPVPAKAPKAPAQPEESAQQLTDVAIDLAGPAPEAQLRPWTDVVSVGTPEALNSARVREQVRWLRGRLPVSRCRLICDFSEPSTSEELYRAEDALDFLVQEGFSIHLCLDVAASTNTRDYADRAAALLTRCANRYSLATLRTWRFELRARTGTDPASEAFVELFVLLKEKLAALGLAQELIGPGCPLTANAENLRAFLRQLKARNLQLAGATIAVRPAVAHTSDASQFVRTADRRLMRSQLLLAREALAAEGFDPNLAMVGGWSSTLEGSNAMNDGCYQAANVCQQLLSCQDLTASICYDWPLDALFGRPGASEARGVLSGRPGLVTLDGIPKPSFTALDFLGHIGSNIVYAAEGAVASANEMGNLQIVAHNCSRLGASYLVTPEERITWENAASFFEAAEPRELRVRIEGAKRGTYLVKKRLVNAQGGSVADAAQKMRLWCMENPSRSELEYLRACSQPQMELEAIVSPDGTLELTHLMQSNEVVYLHVIYLY